MKRTFLKNIQPLIINYPIEKYSADVDYLPNDELGESNVKIEFSPYENSRLHLGLNISTNTKTLHLARVDDIYTIIIDGCSVKLEINDYSPSYTINISDKDALESFVSLISGYYRLMVKWNVDLCSTLQSPMLKKLNALKCHGPIESDVAYSKLKIRELTAGAYIFRQCRKEFDKFFVDIVVRP